MLSNNFVKGNDTLIFLPTYNEAANIPELITRIQNLNLDIDILIIDDNSTDGTKSIINELMQSYPNIMLMQRDGKYGIGSAHLAGIRYAYEKKYNILISMDADFSHNPEDIPLFIKQGGQSDIVVGTRYQRKTSLKEWSLYRKFLTYLGHYLTLFLLRLPYDASGGFRLYRLDKVDYTLFDKIRSNNYEFFFESLTIFHINNCRISEIPIDLPKRVYGHSKMKLSHIFSAVHRLCKLSIVLMFARKRLLKQCNLENNSFNADNARKEWDSYWSKKDKQMERVVYDIIAKFYRFKFISPSLSRFIQKYFKPNAKLLHAGCGGGEVDTVVVKYADVTGLDLSPAAIDRYSRLHVNSCKTIVGNIFNIDVPDESFDGVYNLGVMEHFQDNEVITILKELSRVIKSNGKIILFWPPAYGLSVIGLHIIHFFLNRILKKNIKLHPDEPSKIRSKRQLIHWLNSAGLMLEECSFSFRDAFTYVVVVAKKQNDFCFQQ